MNRGGYKSAQTKFILSIKKYTDRIERPNIMYTYNILGI